MDSKNVFSLLEEMINNQQCALLRCAKRISPSVTADDLLQPNDFPELENHPYFRYEEGLLAGLQSAYMALKAEKRVREASKSGQ